MSTSQTEIQGDSETPNGRLEFLTLLGSIFL